MLSLGIVNAIAVTGQLSSIDGVTDAIDGVVHANVGQNVTPHNPSLGLFLYHFLHTMSS
jgi:hypothetical protein